MHSWAWDTHHTEYRGKLSQLQRAALHTFGQAMKQIIHRHVPSTTHQSKVCSIIMAALQGIKTSSAQWVNSAELAHLGIQRCYYVVSRIQRHLFAESSFIAGHAA